MTLLLLALLTPAEAFRPAPPEPPPLHEVAATLLGQALLSDTAWTDLHTLCDTIGPRLSGSEELDLAIAWSQEVMRRDGLVNVRAEPVTVPVWVRGDESATLLHPVERELPMLGLGGSVGTPEGGIEAEVVVARSFDELAAMPDEAVAGRMVVWDVPFTTYGETVQYRTQGAIHAGRKGAVASLVRSVTPVSLATPHTGNMRYDDEVPPIPAAALTVEDAAWLGRLSDRGITPRVRLEMGAHTLPDVESANVVGEVRGRQRPDEIVLLGCHIDSWDVGQGAQDDGAGCVAVMQAAALINRLPVPPRRTIRVVLYTNEENGLAGARAYRDRHLDALPLHMAALEADTGSGHPFGFRVDARAGGEPDEVTARVIEQLRPVAALLAPIEADGLRPGFAGADLTPIVELGVPGFGVDNDMTGYWPIHHTHADTLDKIDPGELARMVAALAVFGYALAELEDRLTPPAEVD